MGTLTRTAPAGRSRAPLVVGAALPLAVAGLAYLLWWISDRLLYVGPFDRAAFGWIVVSPTWIAVPVAAGFAWRVLDQRTTRAVAVFVGTVIAAVAGLLLWQSVAFPACETGAIHAAQEMILPSLLVGVVLGGGMAVSGLVSRQSARGGRFISAVVLGAACGAFATVAAIMVAAALLLGPVCQRPSI